jgi:hypothetical protein
MIFTILLAISGLTLSAVAIYYSVIGLTAIFAAAFWPIVIMGTTLEISKLVAASWLKAYWQQIPRTMKIYMTTSVVVLMLITSMGIFGFLSKAHLDQNMVSGDVIDKVAIIDEKIKTQRDNIDAARKALRQMDESVDQTMARSNSEQGADKAAALRRSQQRERTNLQNDVAKAQTEIAKLNEQRAPIAKDLRAVEAEVGPIKYIAKLIYGDNSDTNLLEKAVTWVIMVIIFVFDPLAVLMLLASQMTYQWWRKEQDLVHSPSPDSLEKDDLSDDQPEEPTTEEPTDRAVWPQSSVFWPFPSTTFNSTPSTHTEEPKYEQDDGPLTDEQIEQIQQESVAEPVVDTAEENLQESPQLTAAKTRWKDDHPDDSLKHQRKLFELGLLDRLPWEDPKYLDLNTTDQDHEEPKKKETYIIKESDHQIRKTKN